MRGMTITRRVRSVLALFLTAATLSLAIGCAPSFKRNPVPVELGQGASIPSVPRARFWADEDNLSTPDGRARLAEIVTRPRPPSNPPGPS